MGKILIDAGPSPRSLHRLDLFNLCAQLYAFRYLAPKRREGGPARMRGGLTHVGIAHFNRRMQAVQHGEDPEKWFEPVEAVEIKAAMLYGSYPPAYVEVERDRALKIVDQYVKTHTYEIDVDEILSVEEVVWFWVGPYQYTQRPDDIRRNWKTKRVRVRDHKSAAEPTRNTFSGYAPSLQMLAYRWWGPQMFPDVWDGVELNVIPTRADEKGVLPAPIRKSLEPAPALVARLPQLCHDTEMRIAALVAEKRPWDRYPAAVQEQICVRRYGKCEEWDRCLWGKELPPEQPLTQLVWRG